MKTTTGMRTQCVAKAFHDYLIYILKFNGINWGDCSKQFNSAVGFYKDAVPYSIKSFISVDVLIKKPIYV